MQLDTLGVKHFSGYIFPVSVTEDLSVLSDSEAAAYYKILIMKSGTCHCILGQKEFVLTGAYALCLNDIDRFELIGNRSAELTVLLFRPGAINTVLTVDMINCPDPALSQTSYQDLFFLKEFRHDAGINLKIVPLRVMDLEVIGQKLRLLSELLTKQDTAFWPCRSRSYLFEILFCLMRQEEKDEPVRSIQFYQRPSKLAIQVIYYLQTCYSQKISIERLTEEFHTNRTTLLNDFKKHTGQSINQYLIQLRLSMATTLLRDTELSVDEICERTGFSDNSYFSKVFKKGLNITPSEYRKIYHQMS